MFVSESVGISVSLSAMLAAFAGMFLLRPKVAEPHDPEREYQKLVARLRRDVE